ncbi:hypothetical protein OG225_16785 [Nocardia sp. NBC_01377]
MDTTSALIIFAAITLAPEVTVVIKLSPRGIRATDHNQKDDQHESNHI